LREGALCPKAGANGVTKLGEEGDLYVVGGVLVPNALKANATTVMKKLFTWARNGRAISW
jgi:hypothetical protein